MYILHLVLKTGADQENSRKYLPFGEKIVKIGPVDTEIALLIVKKNLKNKEKKKKLMQAKYIALPASLPSGLNEVLTQQHFCQKLQKLVDVH